MNYVEIDIFDLPEMHEPILDKTKKTRLGTFFSGYDSQAMAYERLKKKGIDYELVCISEIDPPVLKVHKALWGDVLNLGAVGTFERLPGGLDIATWSFPCQDISNVGKQRGMVEGSRSNYGYTFLETVKNTPKNERPKVLLMENVKALVGEKFEQDLKNIKNMLKECGYENHIAVLNAKDYGVAQRRERVFILSILDGGYYEFPKPIPLQKTIEEYLEKNVGEKYYLKKEVIQNTFLDYKGGFDRKKVFLNNINRKDISQTITTKMDRAESQYITEPFDFTIKTEDGKYDNVVEAYGTFYKENGYIPKYFNPYHRSEILETTPTLTTTCGGWQNSSTVGIFDGVRVRKLTERECFRLMDVDEPLIDIILANSNKTNAYKMAGNSIVVGVLEKIFEQLY